MSEHPFAGQECDHCGQPLDGNVLQDRIDALEKAARKLQCVEVVPIDDENGKVSLAIIGLLTDVEKALQKEAK